MWNSAGPLLQVTIGRTLGEAAADASPSAVQQLSALIDAARVKLQSRGIVLPEVLIQSDDQLGPDSVVSYIGLERHSDQVTGLENIVTLLTDRVTQLSTPALGLADVQALLAQAVASVAADNYDQALAQYSRAYYHSQPQGHQAEMARSLSDAGTIYVRNGDLDTAIALLRQAVKVSRALSSDAAGLQSQTTLNLANAQLLAGNVGGSAAGFLEAVQHAHADRNSALYFVAVTGWASACCRSGNDPAAAKALAGAAKLVSVTASALAKAVSDVLATMKDGQHAAAGSHAHEVAFGELQRALHDALTSSLPSGAVCKLFTVKGGTALGLFGTGYNLNDPVFESGDATGDTIIQNMKVDAPTIVRNMKVDDPIDPTIIQNMKVDDPTIIQNMKVDDPTITQK